VGHATANPEWVQSKTAGARPAVEEFELRLLLSRGLDPGGEAGLVAGSSVLVDDALFNALVDERNRLAVKSLSLGLIAGGDSGLELTELGAQAGLVGAVNRGLRFRLP